MRKFFIISILIIILGSLVWVVYLVWRDAAEGDVLSQPEAEVTIESASQKEGEATNQKLVPMTDFPLTNYWVNSSTGAVFLLGYDGKVEKIENLKNKSMVSDQGLRNIFRLNPSPDGAKALINLTIFDGQTYVWTPLPSGTTAATWHPQDSQKIAYLTNEGLFLLDLKSGQSGQILKLNNRDLQVDWPSENEIYLSDRPSAAHGNSIWLINVKNKTIEKFLNGESLLSIKWSSAGWGIKTNDSIIIDKNKTILVRLEDLTPGRVFYTAPSKCLTTEGGFYCAVPANIPAEELNVLDKYLKREIYTNDHFYFVAVDAQNKRVRAKLLLRADELSPMDATNLQLMADKLFFINRYDQKLYFLKIK